VVYYGYGEGTPGWRQERAEELARRLNEFVNTLYHPGGPGVWHADEPIDPATLRGKPYVETGPLYDGTYVRIRKITRLSEREQRGLVEEADRIYDEVMGGSGR
jgi:hypothetical protein